MFGAILKCSKNARVLEIKESIKIILQVIERIKSVSNLEQNLIQNEKILNYKKL